MWRSVGTLVLGLSATGYPLTQLAIRRWGARGAVAVEAVCAGLVVRDAAMIASGVPRRLRRGPALLLWLELGAGLVAVAAGLDPRLAAEPAEGATSGLPVRETVRRAAVASLFNLHTIRFRIYLRPDQGRRTAAA